MKYNKGLISVILPVYNCEAYIKESIDSILEQTYKNFEIIIIDDGSTDNTLPIIKKYNDSRIKLISRENKGLICSLNEGLLNCSGEYIARMDADDISLSNRFEKQVDFLEQNKEIGVVGTSVNYIDDKGLIIGDNVYSLGFYKSVVRLLMAPCLFHPSVMMRADKIKTISYRSEYIYAEDFKFWSEMVFDNNIKIRNISDICLNYRIHSNNISKLKKKEQFETTLKIIHENFYSLGVFVDIETLRDLQLIIFTNKKMKFFTLFKNLMKIVSKINSDNCKYIIYYIFIVLKKFILNCYEKN